MQLFTYLFWPNPANATYASPKAVALLAVCVLLLVAAAALRVWRQRLKNPVTRRLSRSWSTASFWFGLVGIALTVARVEQIGYVSMRVWWLVWLAALAGYLWVQVRTWRARHYEVLPMTQVSDPRSKYLPRKKKRS